MNVHRPIGEARDTAKVSKAFVWPHTVTFGETNVMGNVYFARHFDWQGECREMFLKAHCPAILQELARDLRLVTLNAHAEFFGELFAFDEIELHMRLGFAQQHRIGLRFDVVKQDGAIAARGAQDVGCMRLRGGVLEPTALPPDLLNALVPYGG